MKVIAIYVASIDGKIARNLRDPLDWVSSDDRKFFRAETTRSGVMIMGRKTHLSIGKPLKHRLNIVMTKSPAKYSKEAIEGLLEFTDESPQKIISRLKKEDKHESVFVIGGSSIYSQFMQKRLIDEVWISVEPIFFGAGISPFDLKKPLSVPMELMHVTTLNKNTVLLKYRVDTP
ncbi:dihydrofolate reductase [candidate division WWE3 bacterium]|uniref:Dihydrofolate reductase n=1 Tax=candidate division WWE3 bacterium TaxID=2053526 RepID=A0A955LGC6_UNCKA|nr:dihydrofolate reductase [candidate division WWE3 bacterium]